MREPVSLEEYGEAADRRIRELADQPMDLSGLETVPHIAGSLHSAAPGDSISSIMGSSDPGAIGAFMQANDLNGTGIRAGQSYLVPERDSFTAPGARTLGQQGLNTDNALATQRAQDRLDRGMAAIGNTLSGFDPLKGLLATVPGMAARTAPNAGRNQSAEKYQQAGNAIDITGKVLDGFDLQNALLGLKDGGRAAATLNRFTGPAGLLAIPAENIFNGIGEVKNGAAIAPVAVGVASKSGGQALGVIGGAAAGAKLGTMFSATPATASWAPVFIGGGGIIGGILGGLGMSELYPESYEEHGKRAQKIITNHSLNPHWFGGSP
jgi:hypothetical protein